MMVTVLPQIAFSLVYMIVLPNIEIFIDNYCDTNSSLCAWFWAHNWSIHHSVI